MPLTPAVLLSTPLRAARWVPAALRPRRSARHAKPSKAAPVLAAAGLGVSFVAADAALLATGASAATSSDFARLRQCESGGNYAINTGNGFYGGYQFDRGTWNGLGYPGRPDLASPATQDAAAAQLQAERGWSPWPSCSAQLGLGSSSGSVVTRSVVAPTRIDRRASRSRPTAIVGVRIAAAPTAAPAFPGRVLSVADAGSYRADVATWQHRMALRGWPISVDGYFGRQSSSVARLFATEKHLQLSVLPGEVDQAVWDAAWRLPVT